MVSQLINRVWDIIAKIWKARQDTLHGENHLAQKAEIAVLDRYIRTKFTRGLGRINHRWNRHFSGTIEELLDKSPDVRKQW